MTDDESTAQIDQETTVLRSIGSPTIVASEIARMNELADLATLVAAFFYQGASVLHGWEAAPGSALEAERAASALEVGPDGTTWPPELFGTLATNAGIYVAAAAEQLDGFAVLCTAGASLHPPFPVARAAYELSTRAFWLLDPAATLRQRTARVLLDVWASHEHQIEATPKGHSKEMTAARKQSQGNLAELINVHIPAAFGPAVIDEGKQPSSSTVTIEGERCLSPTDAARHFSEATWGPVKTSWTAYAILCLGTHPNSVFALDYTADHEGDAGGPGRMYVAHAGTLEQLLQLALQPFIAAVGAIWSWRGWEMDELNVICGRINGVLPETVAEDWGQGQA